MYLSDVCPYVEPLYIPVYPYVEPLYRGHHWDPAGCPVQRCPYFRCRFVHSSMCLGLQTVSTLKRRPLFKVSFIERFHYSRKLPESSISPPLPLLVSPAFSPPEYQRPCGSPDPGPSERLEEDNLPRISGPSGRGLQRGASRGHA